MRSTITVPINDVITDEAFVIRIRGAKTFTFRVQLAGMLIRLALWVMPFKSEIEFSEGSK